jgi:hypothetical protein
MSRSDRRLLLVLAVSAALIGLAPYVVGLSGALLHMAPALTLLGLLFTGRYVGEEVIFGRSHRFGLRPSGREPRARKPLPRSATLIPRGSLLIAWALAMRPPPAPSVS